MVKFKEWLEKKSDKTAELSVFDDVKKIIFVYNNMVSGIKQDYGIAIF